mgnify:CR=1 FL=1
MNKKEFLLNQKNIAVVGVTTDPQKYGYKIYQCLKQHSLNVYGVSIKYQQIDQDPLYSSLEAIPESIDLGSLLHQSKFKKSIFSFSIEYIAVETRGSILNIFSTFNMIFFFHFFLL